MPKCEKYLLRTHKPLRRLVFQSVSVCANECPNIFLDRAASCRHKYTSDIRPLLLNAKELTNKRPNTVIKNGAQNFHEAFTKEFFTTANPRTRHISDIRGDHNNNKTERMNEEVRDRKTRVD